MAGENVAPKRNPVKSEENPPQPPSNRPPLKFIEDTLGHPLTGSLLSVYHEGFFDSPKHTANFLDAPPHADPLTPLEIRAYAQQHLAFEARQAARLRMAEMEHEKRRAAAEARETARRADPKRITCTRCSEQFEFLRTMPIKLCGPCAEVDLAERDAAWLAKDREQREAERARIAREREVWTSEQWATHRRSWREELNTARKRRKRAWRLEKTIKASWDLHYRLQNHPAAKDRLKKHDACREAWRTDIIARRDRVEKAEKVYEAILEADCERRNIHPEFTYCRLHGLPIPWERWSFYCDDKCQEEVSARGEVHSNMGVECSACGARLKGTQAAIDALPQHNGEIFHTYECLMSSPYIDEDDFSDVGPDAECWKPILHAAGLRPAWSYTERRKLILSSPAKVLAMTGGPTAKKMLAEMTAAAALAGPQADVLALSEFSSTGPEHRLIDFVKSLPLGTVVCPSHARGQGIADNGLLPALFEAVADRGIFGRVKKGYRLAQNPDKTDRQDRMLE